MKESYQRKTQQTSNEKWNSLVKGNNFQRTYLSLTLYFHKNLYGPCNLEQLFSYHSFKYYTYFHNILFSINCCKWLCQIQGFQSSTTYYRNSVFPGPDIFFMPSGNCSIHFSFLLWNVSTHRWLYTCSATAELSSILHNLIRYTTSSSSPSLSKQTKINFWKICEVLFLQYHWFLY